MFIPPQIEYVYKVFGKEKMPEEDVSLNCACGQDFLLSGFQDFLDI